MSAIVYGNPVSVFCDHAAWACPLCPGWFIGRDPLGREDGLVEFMRSMATHHMAWHHVEGRRPVLLRIGEAFGRIGLHRVGVWFVRRGVRA